MIIKEHIRNEKDKIKDLCYTYNNTKPSEREKQKNILEKLFQEKLDNPLIEAPFYCEYGKNISIGKDFYASHNLILLDEYKIIIGDNTSIGPNTTIYTTIHPKDTDIDQIESQNKITIGNNVKIGANVTICPGVEIGDNTIIESGSIVKDNIPKNVIAAGNPCKITKKINKVEKI